MSEQNQQTTPPENWQNPEKQKFKNMICYIPFVAPVLFFVEQEKTPELNKHIKYGIALLFWCMLVSFVLNTFLPFLHLGWALALFYLIASGYLWFKAYNGEDFNIKSIDDIEKKVKENMK